MYYHLFMYLIDNYICIHQRGMSVKNSHFLVARLLINTTSGHQGNMDHNPSNKSKNLLR